MHQHTGQHILSQSFIEVTDAETVGFHLGREISTIDLNIPSISEETLVRVENRANGIIMEDKPVTVHLVTGDEAKGFPLRKPLQAEGTIRIVEVDQFDWSGCCGTHVRRTGEIGLIKIIREEKYKGGLRISFICGERALKHYQKTYRIVRELKQHLSAGEEDLSSAVIQMLEDRKSLIKTVKRMEEQILIFEAQSLADQGILCGEHLKIIHCFERRDEKSLQQLARCLVKEPGRLVLLCSRLNRPFVVVGRSKEINWDVRPFIQQISAIIQGGGGGSADFGQAAGSRVSGLEEVLQLGETLNLSLSD
jgi:alanyl-tRNA synthetase